MKCLLVTFLALTSLFATAQDEKTWTNKSELGLTEVTGNSETTVIQAAHKSTLEASKNKYQASGAYNYGTAENSTGNKELNIRNWEALLRYDRSVSDVFGWYIQTLVKGDRFLDIKWRAELDIPGLKYQFIKQDNEKDRDYFYTQFAYRFSVEELYTNPEPADFEKENHHTVLGFYYSKPIGTSIIGIAELEVSKRLSGDERTMADAFIGLENTLSEIFALKVGYTVNYDDSLEDRGFESDTQRTFDVKLIATY